MALFWSKAIWIVAFLFTRREKVKTDWAAQARLLSNAAHWAEDVLFGVIGFLALLQAFGVLGGALLYLYPALLVMAGLLIPIILFGHSHERMQGSH
jgi:hypothetical protein